MFVNSYNGNSFSGGGLVCINNVCYVGNNVAVFGDGCAVVVGTTVLDSQQFCCVYK